MPLLNNVQTGPPDKVRKSERASETVRATGHNESLKTGKVKLGEKESENKSEEWATDKPKLKTEAAQNRGAPEVTRI